MIDFVIFMLKCFTLSAATCSGVIPNLSAALTKAELSIKTSTQLLDLKKVLSASDNIATATSVKPKQHLREDWSQAISFSPILALSFLQH